LNDQHEEVIQKARVAVATEFGVQAAETPVLLLEPDEFARVATATGKTGAEKALGMYAFGRVVVQVDPAVIQRFGDRVWRKTLSHEFAHGAVPGQNIRRITTIARADLPGQNDQRITARERALAQSAWALATQVGWHSIKIETDAEFMRSDPDLPPNPNYDGAFWVEGLAEAHAIDTLEVYDPKWAEQYDGHDSAVGVTPYNALLLSNDNASVISEGSSTRLRMPWRYVAGVASDRAAISRATAAAYGIDLLEQRLPGLRQQMTAAMLDVRHRPEVRQRINTISTPPHSLYEYLGTLSYTSESFYDGLQYIAGAIATPK
jgi:hypothetical protein